MELISTVVLIVVGVGFAFLGLRAQAQLLKDRRRFEMLSVAATISDANGSLDETVQRLVELVVPDLADVCVIDILRDDHVERLAVAARGPRAAEIEAGMRRRAVDKDRPAPNAAAAMQ